MTTVESRATRRNGVTLVRVTLTNDQSTPQRISLRHCVDGEVWTPRAGADSRVGWTSDTWEGIVAPAESRGLGFATPVDANAPFVEVVYSERVAADTPPGPEKTLDSLEHWSPPNNVLFDGEATVDR